MRQNPTPGGAIVATASISGVHPIESLPEYVGAKAGVSLPSLSNPDTSNTLSGYRLRTRDFRNLEIRKTEILYPTDPSLTKLPHRKTT